MKIPDGWHNKTLGNLCPNTNGIQTGPFGSQLHAHEYTDDGIPVVMPKDLIAQRISEISIARISESRASKLQKHKLEPGDIVFGRRGEIGRCALVMPHQKGWICGTGCLRVRVKKHVSPEFLVYFLGLPHTVYWLESNAVGQTMLNLNTEILSALPILLPPLEEQRAIAEILSTWDEGIRLVEGLIAAKEQRKRGLMQRLLTGQVRFQGFEKRPWRTAKLDEFFHEFSKRNSNREEITVLSCSKIYGIVPQTVVFDKRVASKDTTRYKVVERGDLVYDPMLLWDASIGFVESVDRGVISPAYNTFKFNENSNAEKDYFKFLFKSHLFRHYYKIISQGTNVRRRKAPASAFLGLTFPFPTERDEQRRIAAVLQACDEEIALLRQKLAALQQQKKGLMQRLLTGQIRVPVPGKGQNGPK